MSPNCGLVLPVTSSLANLFTEQIQMDQLITSDKFLTPKVLASLNNKLLVSGRIYHELHVVPPLIFLDERQNEHIFSKIYVHDLKFGNHTEYDEHSYMIVRMAIHQLIQLNPSFSSLGTRISVLGKGVYFTVISIENKSYLTAIVKHEKPTPQEETQDPDLLPENEMQSFTNQS